MKNAYVTIYFTIVFSLVTSLFLGMMYGVRSNGLRMRAKQVVEIALDSSYAEYQKDLFDTYKLLLIDCGYSTGVPSLINLENRFITCMNKNFDELSFPLLGGKDMYKLNCIDASVQMVRFATDDVGASINRQAVKYMGYRYGAAYVEKIFDKAFEYDEVGTTSEEIEKACKESLSKIKEYGLEDIEVKEITDTVDEAISIEDDSYELTLLKMTGIDVGSISGVRLNKEVLISNRVLNEGNYPEYYEMNFKDTLLFKEYLFENCGNYLKNSSDSVLSYETEYLLAGDECDSVNLEKTICKILLMREGINLVDVLTDQQKVALLRAKAETIALILMSPEAVEPLTLLLATVEAYERSVRDVNDILKGKETPDKMTYADYLRLLLLLEDKETLTVRFMDLVETNVRHLLGTNEFRLDYCIDEFMVKAFVDSEYGYEFTLERSK